MMLFKHVLPQHCSQKSKGEVENTALLCLSLPQPALGLDCLSLLQPAIGLGCLSPWQPVIVLDFSLHFLLGLMPIYSLFAIFSLALYQFRQNVLHFIPNEYELLIPTALAVTSPECCAVLYLAFLCLLRGDCFNSVSFRRICSN